MSSSKDRRGRPDPVRRRTVDVSGALLDAAEVVLERSGPEGLTVRSVAEQAGVAPMGIYNHFRDKPGLLLAVLRRAFDALAEATQWPVDLPASEALRAVATAYQRLARERPVTYQLMFGMNSSTTLTQVGEPADNAFRQLVAVVQAGQQNGVVRAGDPQVLAGAFWAALHGAVSLEVARILPDAGAAEAVFDALVATIETGWADPGSRGGSTRPAGGSRPSGPHGPVA
jgi:AcrR family transcriptional regulator